MAAAPASGAVGRVHEGFLRRPRPGLPRRPPPASSASPAPDGLSAIKCHRSSERGRVGGRSRGASGVALTPGPTCVGHPAGAALATRGLSAIKCHRSSERGRVGGRSRGASGVALTPGPTCVGHPAGAALESAPRRAVARRFGGGAGTSLSSGCSRRKTPSRRLFPDFPMNRHAMERPDHSWCIPRPTGSKHCAA